MADFPANAPLEYEFPADFNALPAENLERLLQKFSARIRQLRSEIVSRQVENDRILAENLRQNEELRQLNQSLDRLVQERTRELEISKLTLEAQNQELQALGESKEALMHMIVHEADQPFEPEGGAYGGHVTNDGHSHHGHHHHAHGEHEHDHHHGH